VFVLLPTDPWLKTQLCHGKIDTVKEQLVYVQGSQVESLNKTTYYTRGGGNGNTFVKTQNVRELKAAPGNQNQLEIEVRPLTFGLWTAQEARGSGSSYVGIDERHLPKGQIRSFLKVCVCVCDTVSTITVCECRESGVWALKFPRLVLVVSVQDGAYLKAGEKIPKGETVYVRMVDTFFFFNDCGGKEHDLNNILHGGAML
jgi:hypothetical protein